jgi:hypothetical protein
MLALVGCVVRTQSSETKYGFLSPSTVHLVHAQSGATIRICGAYQNMLAWAISVWGRALERTFTVVQDCGGNQDVNIWWAGTQYAKEQCARYNFGPGKMFTFTSSKPMTLVECGGFSERALMTNLLHEAGHLFGLCDQYDASIHNCAVNFGVKAGSVMNSADTIELTVDDIDGIRALSRARRQ